MSENTLGNGSLRLLTGIALLALVFALLLIERLNVGFTLFIALFAVVGLREYHNMAQRDASRWERLGGFTFVLAMMVAAHYSGFHMLNVVLLLAVLGLATLHLFSGTRKITGLATAVFGIVYVGWFPAQIVLIKQLGFENDGGWLVILLILVVAATDTAAYVTGKNIGRHKLAPKISPKKTWEGAIGAVVGAASVGTAWGYWKADEYGVIHLLSPNEAMEVGIMSPYALGIAAAIISIIAQIGDLAESMLKRDAGIKDSGTFLPGHGGVLDRCDGFLFAGPVLYLSLGTLPALSSF